MYIGTFSKFPDWAISMQSTATFRFCGTLRFAPIQNLRYSGQSTAGMVVRVTGLVFRFDSIIRV